MIGVGDKGVRKALKMPTESPTGTDLAKACDFMSVTPGNKLAISEVKRIEGGKIDVDAALAQLKNVMNTLKSQNLAADVARIELIIPKGAPFKNTDLAIVDGYLIRISTGKKRVTFDGFSNHVKVIEL